MSSRINFSLGLTLLLLLIPLIAMQFTNEVTWGALDFLIGGVLLFGLFFSLSFTYSRLNESKYRWSILIVIVLIFILIWAELAVGIFGTSFGGS